MLWWKLCFLYNFLTWLFVQNIIHDENFDLMRKINFWSVFYGKCIVMICVCNVSTGLSEVILHERHFRRIISATTNTISLDEFFQGTFCSLRIKKLLNVFNYYSSNWGSSFCQTRCSIHHNKQNMGYLPNRTKQEAKTNRCWWCWRKQLF